MGKWRTVCPPEERNPVHVFRTYHRGGYREWRRKPVATAHAEGRGAVATALRAVSILRDRYPDEFFRISYQRPGEPVPDPADPDRVVRDFEPAMILGGAAPLAYRGRKTRGEFAEAPELQRRKKNPTRGEELLRSFHGKVRVERVPAKFRVPAELLEVGRLVTVEYDPPSGSRFGRVRFKHRFGDRPRLFVGEDGRGAFAPGALFTRRGFVNPAGKPALDTGRASRSNPLSGSRAPADNPSILLVREMNPRGATRMARARDRRGRYLPRGRGRRRRSRRGRSRSYARSYRRSRRGRRRARRNPFGFSFRGFRLIPSTGTLVNAVYGVAGFVGTRALPMLVLKGRDTGAIGYVANVVSAGVVAMLVRMVGGAPAAGYALTGGLISTGVRALREFGKNNPDSLPDPIKASVGLLDYELGDDEDLDDYELGQYPGAMLPGASLPAIRNRFPSRFAS